VAGLIAPVQSQPAASPPTAVTPIEGARRAVLALKEDRLEDFAAAMHPEALTSFRTLLQPVLDGAVRENKQAEVLMLFEGAADVEAVKKLSEPQFFVTFLRGALAKADLKKTLAGANYRFLGTVQEGETAHVVYRMAISFEPGRSVIIPSVISMKKHGTQWGALLTGDVEGMAQVLALRFSGAKPEEVLGEFKTEPKVIGHVTEGKDAAHVVVRWTTTGGPARFSKMSAHTLKPKDPGWKLLMQGNRTTLELHLKKNYAPF
jgi:hypothetical protein